MTYTGDPQSPLYQQKRYQQGLKGTERGENKEGFQNSLKILQAGNRQMSFNCKHVLPFKKKMTQDGGAGTEGRAESHGGLFSGPETGSKLDFKIARNQ